MLNKYIPNGNDNNNQGNFLVDLENSSSESSKEKGSFGSILVIDDDITIQELLKNCLKAFGYNVFITKDGEEGLDFYMKNYKLIDLVLLDLVMPKINGEDVLRIIIEFNIKANVIICSGTIDDEKKSGVLSSAKGFLAKPFGVFDLKNEIERIFNDK